MPVRANEKYEATVETARFTTSAVKGTPGLFLEFKTGDGMVDVIKYLTEGSIKHLKENLAECFGVNEDNFSSDDFYTGGVQEILHGKPCSITTEFKKDSNDNIYKDANGKTYATVQWINPSRAGKPVDAVAVGRLKSLFGGNGNNEPPPTEWGPDPDVPF